MRKSTLTILTFLGLFFLTCNISQAKTIINLLDTSGSISDCDTSFKSNLRILKGQVNGLKKNDRFIVYSFRSHGEPFRIVDYTFPNRNGGKNKNIIKARRRVQLLLGQGVTKALSKENQKKYGAGTDCIGALNYTLMTIANLNLDDVEINVLGDGIQTTGIGSFSPKSYKRYLGLLSKKLDKAMLGKPNHIENLTWYGEICYDPKLLNLSESVILRSQLQGIWTSFLTREMPGTRINYLLDYSKKDERE